MTATTDKPAEQLTLGVEQRLDFQASAHARLAQGSTLAHLVLDLHERQHTGSPVFCHSACELASRQVRD